MLVNNEVSALQPVVEIGAIARGRGILMHMDAVQGIGLLDVKVDTLQMDLISLSAHKIYGPKGIGALYVRHGGWIEMLTYWGPQERGLRVGKENTPGIVSLGAAVCLTQKHIGVKRQRFAQPRQYLIEDLHQRLPEIIVNVSEREIPPHVLSVRFPRADAEMMLIRLNGEGISVSLGSACNSQAIEPSHVLNAMGLLPD